MYLVNRIELQVYCTLEQLPNQTRIGCGGKTSVKMICSQDRRSFGGDCLFSEELRELILWFWLNQHGTTRRESNASLLACMLTPKQSAYSYVTVNVTLLLLT